MSSEAVCFKCKFEGVSESPKCPRCGGLLRSKTSVRVRGGLMIVLGGMLMVMMGALAMWAVNANRDIHGAGARFTGTPGQFRMILGLFGLIFVFGLASVVAGLWQLIFGRRQLILMWAAIALGVLLVIGGIVVYSAL